MIVLDWVCLFCPADTADLRILQNSLFWEAFTVKLYSNALWLSCAEITIGNIGAISILYQVLASQHLHKRMG